MAVVALALQEMQEPVDEFPVAIDLALTLLESRIDACKVVATEALKTEDFSKVPPLMDEITKRREVGNLVKQALSMWETLHGSDTARAEYHRAKPGTPTPRSAYWLPVLGALIDLGGTARTSEVVDAVGKKMDDLFTDVDRERLPINHRTRWQNAAEWARIEMKPDGYIAKTPRGTWGITDAGREFYARMAS